MDELPAAIRAVEAGRTVLQVVVERVPTASQARYVGSDAGSGVAIGRVLAKAMAAIIPLEEGASETQPD